MASASSDRFEYLVKTLSRTKRKDYENYIVNAVWNRLNDRTIKPASQWYVKNDGGGWYLIDLYFPQINFGVECDEEYHGRHQDEDWKRELTLTQLLSTNKGHPYTPFHIDVTRPYEEVEQKIDECVRAIQKLVRQRRRDNDFIDWTSLNLVTYFKEKQLIRTTDDITFPSIVMAVNLLMKSHAKSFRKGYFTPKGLKPEYKFWFPQLEIAGKAQAYGWHNILSDDGEKITEFNDDIKNHFPHWQHMNSQNFLDYTRIVFAKDKDPITNQPAYKFVGVFKLTDITDDKRTYKKISDTFDADEYKV